MPQVQPLTILHAHHFLIGVHVMRFALWKRHLHETQYSFIHVFSPCKNKT